jgi:hypothetical protein
LFAAAEQNPVDLCAVASEKRRMIGRCELPREIPEIVCVVSGQYRDGIAVVRVLSFSAEAGKKHSAALGVDTDTRIQCQKFSLSERFTYDLGLEIVVA